MKKTFYSIAEARKQLGALVHRVQHAYEKIALGHYGKFEAYLIPVNEKFSTPEEADPEILFNKTIQIEKALDILQSALLLDSTDRNPYRLYRLAAQKKGEEILTAARFINKALNFEKLKLFSKEFLQSLSKADLDNMSLISKIYPEYVKKLKAYLNSFAG